MNTSHLPPDVRSHSTRAQDLLDDTDQGRAELIKPLILLGVCAPISVAILAMGDEMSLLAALIGYPVALVVGVVLGMVALVVGVAIGAIDEGGPLFLGLVRMAGAIAAMQLTMTVLSFLPLFLLSLIIAFFIFAGILEWLFEFTLTESAAFALLLVIVQIIAGIVMMSIVSGL